MPSIAYTPSPEFWLMLGTIVTGIGRFAWQFRKDRREQASEAAKEKSELAAASLKHSIDIAEREQVRLDLAAVASLTADQLRNLSDQLTTVDENGKVRLKVLLGSNLTTRQYAKAAIDTSNGIKAALMENGVKLVTDPNPGTTPH